MTAAGIPRIGLGTSGRTGSAGLASVLTAIELGYRHVDTAQTYGTERVVGEAVRRSGVPRDAFFITTKVADTRLARRDFLPSVSRSLDDLAMDYVDLTLIHWPSHGDAVPFREYMESLVEARLRGFTRLIGVSNFPSALVERAVEIVGPGQLATNQVELHPFLQSRALRACCRHHQIPITAYMPLAGGRVTSDPVLRRIGANHRATPAAVALAWLLARGAIVIPASERRDHLADNLAAAAVRLTEAELSEIDGLDRDERLINPGKSPAWD